LVMEDAVSSPARQQGTLPTALRKSESRHLIIEVEVEHLRLVDGQIGLLALRRQGGVLDRYRCGVSPGARNRSQILRPGVTEAAGQSVAEPFGDLHLKRVIPGIAIALVLVIHAAELREWPQGLSQGGSGREAGVRLHEASRRHAGGRDRLREQVEITR